MQAMKCGVLFCLAISVLAAAPQNTSPQNPAAAPAQPPGPLKNRPDSPQAAGQFRVDPGTHILLSMINSVSTKEALVGDRIYLETAFPVLVNGHIVVPQGSWVTGTITEVKRPGRVKGRGSLQVRFDSLTLPNGANRDFRADLGALDSRENETLNREGSKVRGPGDKKTDVGTVIGTTTAGTVIGSGIGAATRGITGAGMGAGIGAGAGAAAGLLGVLLTRGPDATLNKGSTVEMVLDRPLVFSPADLDFSNAPPRGYPSEAAPPPRPQRGLPSRIPY
jgi:type IV secretion system protein VirB10